MTALTAPEAPSMGTGEPGDDAIWVTEQPGRVIRIDGGRRTVELDLGDRVLLGAEQGLLGIAFHPDFASDRRVYLHYATPSDEDGVDHYNVIAEYEMLDDQASGAENFRFLRTIKRIPQVNTRRSGGWLGTHLRSTYEGDWLYFATGGNIDESVEAVRAVPYLSTVWGVRPDITDASGEMVNRRWASGVKNPISCDASFFEAGWFHCLLEDAHGAGRAGQAEQCGGSEDSELHGGFPPERALQGASHDVETLRVL